MNELGSDDGLPVAQRRWAFATVVLGISMVVTDATIANIALPTIAADFHADASSAIWVVNAYQLAIVMTLLPLAALGDILGYRRIYLCGLALFTLASLGCAGSHSFWQMILARAVQGLGAAGPMSVNIALVRHIFPKNRLGRALGLNALTVAVAATLSPLLSSAILSVADWRWLFAINLPLGLLTFAVGLKALPANILNGQKFDGVSALLSAVTFGCLLTAIDSIGHRLPWPLIAVQLCIGGAAGWRLVRRQLNLTHPLLPIDLLKVPLFALSIGTSISSFAAQMLAFVSLPFFLQSLLGFSKVETGILMTPWPLAVGISAPIAGRLADRHPASILSGAGLVLLALGLVALAFLPDHPAAGSVMWRMAVCGAGFGLFQSPNNRALISAAPKARSGAAGGLLSMARLTGQTSGAALAALLFARTAANGMKSSLLLAALFAGTAAVVSFSRLVPERRDG